MGIFDSHGGDFDLQLSGNTGTVRDPKAVMHPTPSTNL